MHWNAVLEVLSQNDTNWNGVLDPFFLGISVTPGQNFASLYVSELFLKRNSTGYTK
jgi:hypothetical protein